MLRELALVRLGRYGEPAVVDEARKRFDAHCSGAAVLPADLRVPVSDSQLAHMGLSIIINYIIPECLTLIRRIMPGF